MKIKEWCLQHRTNDAFDIEADENLYRQIVDDMMENAGNFIPRSVWQKLYDDRDISTFEDGAARYQEVQYTDEQIEKNAYELLERYHNMRVMMAAWVGGLAEKEEFEDSVLEPYREFLIRFENPPKLFDAMKAKPENKVLADFRTVEEITMLSHLTKEETKLHVLEIGGGYGRLAEGLMNIYGQEQVQYVLADSVPISLMYCYLYLKKTFTKLKVGFYYQNPDASPSDYDIYIVPTWWLESVCKKNGIIFNLLVNIQSMQEMSQWHVDYYLNLFNQLGREKALIFLNNNKQYIFRGDWNYPSNWKLILRQNTPWSWSEDCPMEVFSKENGDFTGYNLLINALYKASQEDNKTISRIREQISECRTILDEVNLASAQKDKEIENSQEKIASQNIEIDSYQEAIAAKDKEIEAYRMKMIEKDAAIESNKAEVAAKNREIAERNVQIEEKNRIIEDQNIQIEENKIERKRMDFEQKKTEDRLQKAELSLEQSLQRENAMKNTVSWKITKPLRFFRKLMRYKRFDMGE